MSKRRINLQQRERILKKKNEHTQHEDTQQGIVVAHYGRATEVEDNAGNLHLCKLRQHLGEVVVGDQVAWAHDSHGEGVLISLLPRRSVLAQHHPRKKEKPIAANIDQMIIVLAPLPESPTLLIDSYLVAAEALNLDAVIVLNKVDLLPSYPKEKQETFKRLLHTYHKMDYPTLEISTLTNQNLEKLDTYLRGKTSVFVGASGVGKSSLIAKWVKHDALVCANPSLTHQHGTHTTSTARRYPLQNGGYVIDAPGIRQFALWPIPKEKLVQYFREFRPWLNQCKFRNCQHFNEQDCALQKAVTEGSISEDRLKNYRKLAAQTIHSLI